MMASKNEERMAVQKIRNIVSELGDKSYVGTALDGCLDIAESNIENDFGESMKGRWEFSEKKLKKTLDRVDELEKKLEKCEKDRRDMRNRTLSEDDIEEITRFLSWNVVELEKDMENAARRIVEFAENPDSMEFRNAVDENREAKRCLENRKKIFSRMNEILNCRR